MIIIVIFLMQTAKQTEESRFKVKAIQGFGLTTQINCQQGLVATYSLGLKQGYQWLPIYKTVNTSSIH